MRATRLVTALRDKPYQERLRTQDLSSYSEVQGPDLQRILRQTYDSAALTPDLRRACELRAINKKS